MQTTDANGNIADGKFYWISKDGQPTWLWGSNTSPSETYVYNPSNFHVAAANTATSAATAGNVSGKIYYSSEPPSVATDKLFTVKEATMGDGNEPGHGLVIQTGPYGTNWNGKLYISDNGSNGVWVGGVNEGKKVDWTRLVENKGSWNINASTATNADKVDGYHASDIFRHLGGNQTPVITDIFDRAGTIDMTTMSAADKATHKANINKANNVSQNIWRPDTGIYAYGGDTDIAGGYVRGTLKLTQSYKNFDKILIATSNDDGDMFFYVVWDVWELAYMFSTAKWRFPLIDYPGMYWLLYPTTGTGKTNLKA